jgi:hypothetical protein
MVEVHGEVDPPFEGGVPDGREWESRWVRIV